MTQAVRANDERPGSERTGWRFLLYLPNLSMMVSEMAGGG